MHFDAALNLVWLAIGIGAFASALHAPRRPFLLCRTLSPSQLAGVIVLLGTLFPYVSATDDLVWLEAVNSAAEHSTEHGSGRSQGTLANLLAFAQAQDSAPASRAFRISPAFVEVGIATLPVFRSLARDSAVSVGRSPPV